MGLGRRVQRAVGPAIAAIALQGIGAGRPALATDHLLAGTELLATSRSGKGRFVWMSRDAAAVAPASAPSTVGALLAVRSGDGDTASVALGSADWNESADGSRATYSNRDAPSGDSLCRTAIVRSGRMVKVVCRDDLIDTLDAGPEGSVSVRLTIGSDNYCASFGGVVRDGVGRFFARRAPAPDACDTVPTTTSTTPTVSTTTNTCNTTTTIAVCAYQSTCILGRCPPSQSCTDIGGGQCDCAGPPVPCGDVGHPALCGYGECPPGMQCTSAYYPPSCTIGCECR
jgi:hypothetical protein